MFHHSLSPCPGSSPKSPVSDPYQHALSQVDNNILLLIDELDELDEFKLNEVKVVNPLPSESSTHSKFFILNLCIVFFPKQSCTQPPFFCISHIQPLHYVDCMVISSHNSKSLFLLDWLGWITTWIAIPETSSNRVIQTIPVVMYHTTVPIIEYSRVSCCK